MAQSQKSVDEMEAEIGKKRLELTILQLQNEERAEKREQDIEWKISRLEPISQEERDFYFMRQFKHLKGSNERIEDTLGNIEGNTTPPVEEEPE
jgi:hypothetical protein